jgi:hypothetical protein
MRDYFWEVKRKFDGFESSQAMSNRPSDQPDFAAKYGFEK